MTIPTAWLDQLRDRITLSTIIQRSVPLKKKGKEWSACCPFHDEKSPSFTVNDDKAFYHCFGCGAHGDAIRWMTDKIGMQFIDAVKELAAQAGMEVPQSDPRQAQRAEQGDKLKALMGDAAMAFAFALEAAPQGPAAQYLESRDLEIAQVRKFGIGFAPRVPMGDKLFAERLGAPRDMLKLVGLIGESETGRGYDFFRNRITIPIHDARGKVIAFGARALGDDKPKYLNSPDTPIFDKGRTLFNLHRASPAARAKDRLVIVEGYMDVIGLARVGIEEAVAPNGTALTEAQMELAWRLVDVPIVCMDGDRAGKQAALRAITRALPILKPGKALSFAFPPDGADPDDIARQQGAEGISRLLSHTLSISDVIWQECLARMKEGGPEVAAAVRRDVRDMIGTIKDADVREAFMSEFVQRFSNYGKRDSVRRRTPPGRKCVNTAVEEAIFKGVIRHVDRIGELGEALAIAKWTRPEIREILDALIWANDSEPVNRGNLIEVIERRGLGEKYHAEMSRETLRFPFLVGPPTDATFASLYEAIRAKVRN